MLGYGYPFMYWEIPYHGSLYPALKAMLAGHIYTIRTGTRPALSPAPASRHIDLYVARLVDLLVGSLPVPTKEAHVDEAAYDE